MSFIIILFASSIYTNTKRWTPRVLLNIKTRVNILSLKIILSESATTKTHKGHAPKGINTKTAESNLSSITHSVVVFVLIKKYKLSMRRGISISTRVSIFDKPLDPADPPAANLETQSAVFWQVPRAMRTKFGVFRRKWCVVTHIREIERGCIQNLLVCCITDQIVMCQTPGQCKNNIF